MLPSTVKFASPHEEDGHRRRRTDRRLRHEGFFGGTRVVDVPPMGHQDVAVLNGGLKKWKAEGRRWKTAAPAALRTPLHGEAQHRNHARPRRHEGASQEDRHADRGRPSRRPLRRQRTGASAGLRSGHIPGAKNVPSPQLFEADGTLKSAAELAKLFKSAGSIRRSPWSPRAARASPPRDRAGARRPRPHQRRRLRRQLDRMGQAKRFPVRDRR